MSRSSHRLKSALLPLVLATLLPAATTPSARAEESLWPSLDTPPKVPAKAPKEPEGAKDLVLLVAIEEYPWLPHVVGAKSNASDWYKWMTDVRGVPTGNIKLLINERGTPADIEAEAAKLVARSNAMPGGTFWLVYIGHGAPPKPGTGQKSGLLVGVNAQTREMSFYRESLELDGLLRTIESGGQRETVAIIDACFSGRDAVGGVLMEGLQAGVMADLPPVRAQTVVLSAAAANQYAGRLPGERRPAFSYLVLGGLRGWADAPGAGKGQVTAKEIEDYTRRVLLDLSDVEQTPEARGRVDVVLTRAATEPAPALAPIKARLAFGGPPSRATEAKAREVEPRPVVRPEQKAPVQTAAQESTTENPNDELGRELEVAARAEFVSALGRANRLELDGATPEELAAAWERVAAAPVKGEDATKKEAAENARTWRETAAQLTQMRAQWKEVSGVIRSKTVAPEKARSLLLKFLENYAKFQDEPELVDARRALADTPVGARATEGRTVPTRPTGSPAGYVLVSPGRFRFGVPPRDTAIDHYFFMKATEVTQGEWQAVMGSNPSVFGECGTTCPVENVSWFDAIKFANKLSESEGLPVCYEPDGRFRGPSCLGYRLPTSAEWEFAARAGNQGTIGSIQETAWVFGMWGGGATQKCGTKKPNAWGLYDMLGNVHEWVQDFDRPGGKAATGALVPSEGDLGVIRGGGWEDEIGLLEEEGFAYSASESLGRRGDGIGFRLVRTKN